MKAKSDALSKREVVALMFAAALVGSRDGEENPLNEKTNAAVMRDAFAFADCFLRSTRKRRG